MEYREYVVGLAFNEARTHLALINKQRPAWQKHRLNGPGGKMEDGETPEMAISREYWEETGRLVEATRWIIVAVVDFPLGRVYFLTTTDDIMLTRTTTDENVVLVSVNDLKASPVVPNLRYLVPLALNYAADDSGSKLQLPVYLTEA